MKVYCIGMGIVTSNAQNCDEFTNVLFQQRRGISDLSTFMCNNYRACSGAEIRGYRYKEKFEIIIEQALDEGLLDAGLELSYIRKNCRVGMVLGTSLGNLAILEAYLKNVKEGNASSFYNFLMSNISNLLSRKLMLRGPTFTISNTCVSGINAVAVADQLIREERIDVCLVGGVEIISEFIYSGLDSLNALSERQTLEPFSIDRDGIVLGEAAGFLILSNEKAGEKYGQISGYSITNDASHLTSPDRNGRGLRISIDQSLRMANLNANEIDCIFCCGNGTKYNDAMQAKVINEVWGNNKDILVTTIKPLIGHTLGAAGIVEGIGILIMMENGWIVPIGEPYKCDPVLSPLPLLHKMVFKSIDNAILLGSGFSGVNGSLVIKRSYL